MINKKITIRKAALSELSLIHKLVIDTIREIYPHYYPTGAVHFFINHHSEERIQKDLIEQNVYLLLNEERCVGTVTINENEVNRLFILPNEQGKGYGTFALMYAERKIFENYDEAQLHASFSGKMLYIKHGYKEWKYRTMKTENGDYLCVDIMKKERE